MVSKKIWVKRPGASATLVHIDENDLVDDARANILKKYANSLGRHFDAPDVTLKIFSRGLGQDRLLGPDEPIAKVIDLNYPGGQKIEEALVITISSQDASKLSPRPARHYHENRPTETCTDYFPLMSVPAASHIPNGAGTSVNGQAQHSPLPNSMSVITTGFIPAITSPGGSTGRRTQRERPRVSHQQTPSPSVNISVPQPSSVPLHLTNSQSRSRSHSNASEKVTTVPPTAPPLPTPPTIQATTDATQVTHVTHVTHVATPPIAATSPKLARFKKNRKPVSEHKPNLRIGMLSGGVPPINVLIVEDNNINLKLLEAFMKRLKVRWQTAVNGKIAVDKWKTGGFHLVLMDIQLPVMNGLDATRAIRRLERLNRIGVFSSSASSTAPQEILEEPEEDDELPSDALFKSPVIIVALTASSLQSDRHEALAAGCNDFLTKPVNFVWLERKVMEWGCMQALIDFDGWRKWKDFSQLNEEREKNQKNKVKHLNLNKTKDSTIKNANGENGENGLAAK
ncbi:hypothetical protein K3495_g2358 [Podosphaera aphanis]|nr:hypothetical protein K3495_g2358 [Podosphaera aphanis]